MYIRKREGPQHSRITHDRNSYPQENKTGYNDVKPKTSPEIH